MQFIFELLLQPILEFVFYAIGYGTAWLVVPVITFGRVIVEPGPGGKFVKPKRGRIQSIGRDRYLMDAELAACIGVLFWILVAVGIYLILRAS
jgi:hypothetical protein